MLLLLDYIGAPSFIKERPYTAIGPPRHAGAFHISYFFQESTFFSSNKKFGGPFGALNNLGVAAATPCDT